MPTASYFRSQALRCRQLASSTLDQRTAHTLELMADEYEQQALALVAAEEPLIIKPIQE